MRAYTKIVLLSISMLLAMSCVEEYDGHIEVFEDLLVVETTITNKLETQEVKLSRTFEIEDGGPVDEVGASVKIRNEFDEVYSFIETSNGMYQSQVPFAALPNVEYTLIVETSNGRRYLSKPSSFSHNTQIDDLVIERGFDQNNEEGVRVLVSSSDTSENTRYYRYDYEETYKIIAPNYIPLELHIENDDFVYPSTVLLGLSPTEIVEFFVSVHPREAQEQVCFKTEFSNEILQLDASQFDNNIVEDHELRFISRDNYIISHRYSILVKQYVQSIESYLFYKTLNNFSSSESLFSQVQTGFIIGNMYSETNPNEKVIGFFEVVPVDERRTYFNYVDLFPDEELPPYYRRCDAIYTPLLYTTDPLTGDIEYSHLQAAITDGLQYVGQNQSAFGDHIDVSYPYNMVLPECGDCTFLGENVAPDFWEE